MPLAEALPDTAPSNLQHTSPAVAHDDARNALNTEEATLLSRNDEELEPNLNSVGWKVGYPQARVALVQSIGSRTIQLVFRIR